MAFDRQQLKALERELRQKEGAGGNGGVVGIARKSQCDLGPLCQDSCRVIE